MPDLLVSAFRAFVPLENGRYDSEPAYKVVEKTNKALAKLLKPTKWGKPFDRGPAGLLQECARQNPSTGLPAMADAAAKECGPVIMPVFRAASDLDKKAYKAARMPHEYSSVIRISDDGKHGVAAGTNGKLSFWSLETGALEHVVPFGRERLCGLRVFRNGRILGVAKGSREGILLSADDRTKKPKKVTVTRKRDADSLNADVAESAIDPSGELLAVPFFHGFDDDSRGLYEVVVYDPKGKELFAFDHTTESKGMAGPPPLAFLPDKRLLVGNNREIAVRDPRKNFEVVARWAQPHWASEIAVSHDGSRVLVSSRSWDEKAEYAATQLHDADGRLVGTPNGCEAFAGDMLIATAHYDVSLCSLDGNEIASYFTHRYVEAVGASDGTVLLGTRTGNDPGATEVLRLIR